jgi:hypothetical protein
MSQSVVGLPGGDCRRLEKGAPVDKRLEDIYQALSQAHDELGNVLDYEEDYADRQGNLEDVATLRSMAEGITLQLTKLEKRRSHA